MACLVQAPFSILTHVSQLFFSLSMTLSNQNSNPFRDRDVYRPDVKSNLKSVQKDDYMASTGEHAWGNRPNRSAAVQIANLVKY